MSAPRGGGFGHPSGGDGRWPGPLRPRGLRRRRRDGPRVPHVRPVRADSAEADLLGFAVLRDALLVRLMLVPILLRFTGRAASGCRGGATQRARDRFREEVWVLLYRFPPASLDESPPSAPEVLVDCRR
jgi:hypothetical protein